MLRASRTPLAVIASLTLVLQLVGLAHEALAPHVVCAEHGDWVEGTTPSAATAPADSADAIGQAGAVSNGPSHEHCAVLAHRRGAARTEARRSTPVVTLHAARIPVADGVVGLGGLEPLDVAPKASPPV